MTPAGSHHRFGGRLTCLDNGWIDKPVRLIDHADVADRDALMLLPAEASVNVCADHDLRPHSLDRIEQFTGCLRSRRDLSPA
jgi:hypothetical protein